MQDVNLCRGHIAVSLWGDCYGQLVDSTATSPLALACGRSLLAILTEKALLGSRNEAPMTTLLCSRNSTAYAAALPSYLKQEREFEYLSQERRQHEKQLPSLAKKVPDCSWVKYEFLPPPEEIAAAALKSSSAAIAIASTGAAFK